MWDYVEWGGAQIYFFGLIKKIREKAEVSVILPRNSDQQLLQFIENLGVSCEFLDTQTDAGRAENLRRKLQKHWKKFKSERSVLRFLKTRDLGKSVIHIEFAPWQSLFSLVRLCLWRQKVFITMHNSLPRVPPWRFFLWKLKFWIITRFDNFHIFASNQDAKESLRPLVNDNFFKKIRVTYTNVNPGEIDRALEMPLERENLCRRFNIPKDKFLVFCVGQFIDRKGRWTFLEAAKKVFVEDRDFAFVWISNSKPTETDLEKARNHGLGENFIFITSDQVGREHIDLFKLMRLADLFALVSFQEGLPISLLEAMALGLPSISTNVNAIPEAIRHLETGWLIEPGDALGLARAFRELKSDPALRKTLGSKGRELVLEKFDERVVAQIALESYQRAFEGE